MKTSKYFTIDLIPTNGVWITEAYNPKGFTVAKYDDRGMTTAPRWFATMDKADEYAASLS
ncbi:MAG TPA: hypothetical protein VFU31_24780 [Candidatus Binatia bacterium]|nr:hypothetical protein [Candidatus Binatia bacterium]